MSGLRISAIAAESLSDEQIARLLNCGSSDPPPGDLIFVFGAPPPWGNERVATAAKLFFRGKAPRLHLCGGRTAGGAVVEASEMRRHALQLAVPESAITVETESTNTRENVVMSLPVLDRELGLAGVHRIIAVTSAFHLRRARLTLRTYLPAGIECEGCPAEASVVRMARRDSDPRWHGRLRAELSHLVAYVRNGDLLDEEVEIGDSAGSAGQ
ncbi:MAG TPA: YdcF family protein [Limnochordia bacterium]|nr:YdcF family protein [Limnochordia bacterium]